MQSVDIATRVNSIVRDMRIAGNHITVDSIITASLFSTGGTLDNSHSNIIADILNAHRERIEIKVNARYPDSPVKGLLYGIAVNDFFNYKAD